MSMGNNRDYKTTHDRARRNLLIHSALFNDLVATGMTREEADNIAYKSLVARDTNYAAVCKRLGIPAKRPGKVVAQ